MKLSKRQLRKIIKEEKTKLLRESITDLDLYTNEAEKFAAILSDKFGDDMMTLFEEEPEAFEGSSYEDWDQQVVYAQQEIDTGVAAAILKAIEEVETRLHNGDYFDGR